MARAGIAREQVFETAEALVHEGQGAFGGLINLGFCDAFPAASKISPPARLCVSKHNLFITVLLLDIINEF
jgi:hypothetical protein